MVEQRSVLKRFILFLVINFGGLYLGSQLMGQGPSGSWYASLHKAPWTPPGWVFGVAWSLIMFCYAVYLAKFFSRKRYGVKEITLVTWSIILNVLWNYVFFSQQSIGAGLLVLSALLVILVFMFFKYKDTTKGRMRIWLIPYLVWMILAFSLNAYVFLYN